MCSFEKCCKTSWQCSLALGLEAVHHRPRLVLFALAGLKKYHCLRVQQEQLHLLWRSYRDLMLVFMLIAPTPTREVLPPPSRRTTPRVGEAWRPGLMETARRWQGRSGFFGPLVWSPSKVGIGRCLVAPSQQTRCAWSVATGSSKQQGVIALLHTNSWQTWITFESTNLPRNLTRLQEEKNSTIPTVSHQDVTVAASFTSHEVS